MKRLHYVDALRGLAAVLVLIFHTWNEPHPKPDLLGPLQPIVANLSSGVILFFLVSAFSLCYTMRHHEESGHRLTSFYVHRAFRILPLYYAVLAYAWLSGSHFADGLSVGQWLEAITLTYNLDPANIYGFVPAGWTLSVELIFYLVFPFLVLRINSIGRTVTWIAGALLAWFLALQIVPKLGLPADQQAAVTAHSVVRLATVLLVGFLVYRVVLVLNARDLEDDSRRDVGNALTATGILLLWCQFSGWIPPVFGNTSLITALCYAVLFVGLALNPTRLLVNRVTCALGTISYSAYLIHPWVVFELAPVYPKIQALSSVATLTFIGCVALTLAITALLASITYLLIERPGIALGRRLLQRASRTSNQDAE
jgi:peptidoglycan/LPS O-acetylase OafA/YrhL